ncbi:Acyl-coenzyme A thioesterase 13 [Kappamyces sp. JEL0680]|nr:Acyl-coenzyme A thioesterase 13 [Kappamyces sp. JEL0680]
MSNQAKCDLFNGFLCNSGEEYTSNIKQALRVTSVEGGRVVFAFQVGEGHTNLYGTLHGGCIATLIDWCSSLAIGAKQDDLGRMGVSVDLHTTYLSTAKSGDVVEIVSECYKASGRLGFTRTTLHVHDRLIAMGSQTKFLDVTRAKL